LRELKIFPLTALLWACLGLCLAACKVNPDFPAKPPVQIDPPAYVSADAKLYYSKRISEISDQAPMSGGVLFLGDSLIEGGNWQALFPGVESRNHGIGWDTSLGLKKRLSLAAPHSPQQIYLMIGANDIGYDKTSDEIVENISTLALALREIQPFAQIFVQSILPRQADMSERITQINEGLNARLLQDELKNKDIIYLDLTSNFISDLGGLRPDLTYDGVHLNENGYAVWASLIGRMVTRASSKGGPQ